MGTRIFTHIEADNQPFSLELLSKLDLVILEENLDEISDCGLRIPTAKYI